MELSTESLLRIFSLLAFGGGCMFAAFGATTMNALVGIAALICFLGAAVLFVGFAIVAAISDLQHSHPAAAAPPPHKDAHLGTL